MGAPVPPISLVYSRGLCLAAALCVVSVSSWAAILNVPVPYPTIQSAIDWAVDGDEVVVADGAYTGAGNAGISLRGKAITVRSRSGDPSACTIDGGGQGCGSIVYSRSGETSACVLEGFTIRNGGGTYFGGGIWIEDSSPTIRNCIISDNSAGDEGIYGLGGGIGIEGASSPEFIDCTITRNGAGAYHTTPGAGGGVYSESQGVVFRNCTISHNWTAGDGGGFWGDGTFIDCRILSNHAARASVGGGQGGGIYTEVASLSGCVVAGNLAGIQGGGLFGSTCTIEECTFAGNRCIGDYDVGGWGGGLLIWSEAFLSRTIVWGNCSETYPDTDDIGGWVTLTCCCVDTSKGGGTYNGPQVYRDPLFCDPRPCTGAPTSEGDYTLQSNSPCLPAASPCDSLIGALAVGCFAGACCLPYGGCSVLTHDDCEENGGTYMGDEVPCDPIVCGPASGVRDRMPLSVAARAMPNPAGARVTIIYGVPVTTGVNVAILDPAGRLVRRLLDSTQGAGNHSVEWDRRDDSGRPVPSGIYFFRVQVAGRTYPGTIIALK